MSRPHMIGAGRRWGFRLALVVGAVSTAVGVVLALAPAPRIPDAGALPPAAPASGTAPSSLPSRPESGAASPPSSGPPSSGPPPPPPAPAGGSPRQIRIDGLGPAVEVDPVGVDRAGRLDVPADPDRLGWWIGAARPGDTQGTVLVAGHVDTVEAGEGALFRLETVPMGTTVEVTAAGQVFRYRVTARRSFAKTRLPADLFTTGGPPRLVLITCGGRFRDGAYDSNVVVFAT